MTRKIPHGRVSWVLVVNGMACVPAQCSAAALSWVPRVVPKVFRSWILFLRLDVEYIPPGRYLELTTGVRVARLRRFSEGTYIRYHTYSERVPCDLNCTQPPAGLAIWNESGLLYGTPSWNYILPNTLVCSAPCFAHMSQIFILPS